MSSETASRPSLAGSGPAAHGPVHGREVELKLSVAPGDLTKLVRHPVLLALQDGTPVSRRLFTTYFDTPDLQLLARGLALRVRRRGRERIQGVKTLNSALPGDAAGVAVRQEWEWPITGDRPDLSLLPVELLRDILPAEDTLASIRPIFTTDLQRTTLMLRPDTLTAIEVALDTGDVRAGSAQAPISEIELELKAGRVGQLFDLALELQRSVPLRIATRSKAEIGFGLVTGRAPAPAKATPLALTPATTPAEAFRHIIRNCLTQILANEACVLAANDAEGIHQMRVALRRLRSALSLFGDFIQSPEGFQLADEVRWLAGRLGAARDRDILLGHYFSRFPGDGATVAGLEALREAIGNAHHAAHGGAVEAIRSPRYTSLLLALAGWLEEGRWHEGASSDQKAALHQPLLAITGQWLAKRHRKVRRAGRHLARLAPEERHKLRIAVKKLRYAVDFFRSLYAPTVTRPYLEALESLQQVLGELNDGTVSGNLVETLSRGGDDPRRQAARALVTWIDRQNRSRLEQLSACWREFAEVTPFWDSAAS